MDNDQLQDLLSRFEALSGQVARQQNEISRLHNELAQAKNQPKGSPSTTSNRVGTSRRRLLKGLVAGTAGLMVTSAALSTNIRPASARMNITGDEHWGGASVPNNFPSDPDNDFNNVYNGLSNGHIGMIGASESDANFSVPRVVDTGFYGASAAGYGGYFKGGAAALLLEPAATNGAPTSGTHLKGELFADNQGQLYYCRADSTGGNGGTWSNLTSPLTMLAKPIRIVDTVNGTNFNGGGIMTGFGQASGTNPGANLIKTYNGTGTSTFNGGIIPANAKAITGYLFAYPGYNYLTIKPGYGYLTLWQGGQYPLATANEGCSTLRYVNSGEASTAFTVNLNGQGKFSAAASITTHLVIEVTGYYL